MSDDKLRAADAALQESGIRVGDTYRHYKGGCYRVIALAVYKETMEPAVIYKGGGKGPSWVRPLASWLETVEVEGRQVPRFELV